ncbi:MAG TPA: secretin N-terminal domain-containing protein [Opitutaceae bacterium]|jgi:MSHA type pilus biogenesis protein MshL|nr:secretin N-terminal domain-containing protein [Opitutaceae bacterium]
MRFIPLLFLLLAPPLAALDSLDVPVDSFRAVHLAADAAFQTVGRIYGLTFDLEPGLASPVTLTVSGGRVRDLITALARTQGAYWERDGRIIVLRRNVLRFYPIDYPQMTRSAQGSSTVVLTAQSGTTSAAASTAGTAGAAAALAASGLPNQTDQTNLSLQQQNPGTFWSDLQAELAALAQPGERVAVNRLAGLVLVTAPPDRQEGYRAFLRLLNDRISRQVRITAKVLEVDLTQSGQLGVDWSQAATKAGGLSLGGFSTNTAIANLNGTTLPAATFTGTIAAGKIAAVVQALSEQGQVHSVSNPSVLTLSNQTAFVKVGTEQTFFSLANSTTLSQPGTSVPFASTQNNYSQNAITIGTVLYVTPEVNSDGTVTVDILPAVTQLIGVDTSPDQQQTAPRMDIKALSTLARLRPGEAVVIGGLIHDETDTDTRSIPGLGSLPVVGALFGSHASARTRTELVIFLTAECQP